jgi:hypothetical protein
MRALRGGRLQHAEDQINMKKTAVKTEIKFLAFPSCQRGKSLLKTSLETGTFSFQKNLDLPSPARWNFEFFQRTRKPGNFVVLAGNRAGAPNW